MSLLSFCSLYKDIDWSFNLIVPLKKTKAIIGHFVQNCINSMFGQDIASRIMFMSSNLAVRKQSLKEFFFKQIEKSSLSESYFLLSSTRLIAW